MLNLVFLIPLLAVWGKEGWPSVFEHGEIAVLTAGVAGALADAAWDLESGWWQKFIMGLSWFAAAVSAGLFALLVGKSEKPTLHDNVLISMWMLLVISSVGWITLGCLRLQEGSPPSKGHSERQGAGGAAERSRQGETR